MGARPLAWDKYEAALLLEGVLDVQQKEWLVQLL